jgi:hypothetical protein
MSVSAQAGAVLTGFDRDRLDVACMDLLTSSELNTENLRTSDR